MLANFYPSFPLARLHEAPYNPRRISPEAAGLLHESLSTLGVLKAIIAAPDGLILAGHQRTNQMRQAGFESGPVIVLREAVDDVDQMRFNQLHNACDLDFAVEGVTFDGPLRLGWMYYDASRVRGHMPCHANEKREICDLLAKFRGWGNAIATEDGRIVVGGLYALCCSLLRIPLLLRVIPNEDEALVRRYFGRPYGEFSYENIERTTWVQAMAQMFRLRSGRLKSRTYENLVILRLYEGIRVLDFGAGQMDYVHHLRAQGVDIHGLEFYTRRGQSIDVQAVHGQIDNLCRELRTRGRFDMVVCDSVVNSVDSQQAEEDVMNCLRAFCRPGGTVIWSGRNRGDQRLRSDSRRRKRTGNSSQVNFFDENGLTAMARNGLWQFQKYHTIAEVAAMAERYFGPHWVIRDCNNRVVCTPGRSGDSDRPSWGAVATNERNYLGAEIEASIGREFNLPLPDGSRYGRSEDVLNALAAGMWRGVSNVPIN